MPTLTDPADLARLEARLNALRPDAAPLWGKMVPGEMLCHLADFLAQAVGKREVPDQSSLFLRTVVRFLLVNAMPMPKGAPTSPALLASRGGTLPADFEADRERVLALMRENAARPANRPFARHPAFGQLSHRERGLTSWKHIDHHLRQFGV
jgi:hypothetical protein